MGVLIISPHTHTHGRLVEPSPPPTDIHHDMLPLPLGPLRKVNVSVDRYELYMCVLPSAAAVVS